MKQRNSRRRQTEHAFSKVPVANIPRSQFNRSHAHKTTLDGGYLVPILVQEILPGDTWNVSCSAFGRLATPVYPVMDNANLDFFFFFCPYRLVWANFQKFMGEQTDPGDSTDFLVPQTLGHSSTVGHGLLHDYMGVPPTPGGLLVSALPSRSYQKIWNDWFRDENLQDSVVIPTDDGPDDWDEYGGTPLSGLKKRGKRHDYFTSSLPWPSKGPGVEIPIGDTAPITGIATVVADAANAGPTFDLGTASNALLTRPGGAPTAVGLVGGDPGGGAPTTVEWNDPNLVADADDAASTLEVDLSSATAATINSLRQAFQIQKLFERDARGGSRYVEHLKAHWGITNHPDARLQRPEYLGGGSANLIIQTVPQTSEQNIPTAPQGTLAAYGTVGATGIGFNKSFVEHGTLIGLVCARADLTYQQGVERGWFRRTRYDFYHPVFQNLGEQAVLNQEIYVQDPATGGATPENTQVWGYQERWSEYRYQPSRVSVQFREDHATSLESWHLAEHFPSLPTLDSTFIEDPGNFDQVIAVTSEPHFILDTFFNIKVARAMPVHSVPGLIDHF